MKKVYTKIVHSKNVDKYFLLQLQFKNRIINIFLELSVSIENKASL